VLRSSKFYRSIRLLGTPRHSPARAYNDFYFETRGPVGNPHILPLQELAEGLVKPENYPKIRAGALDQVDKLMSLLPGLDVRQARPSQTISYSANSMGDRDRDIVRGKAGFDLLLSLGVDGMFEKEEENRYGRQQQVLIEKLNELRMNLMSDGGGHFFRLEADLRMRARGLDACKDVIRLLTDFRRSFFFLELTKDELKRGEFESRFIEPLYEGINWDAAVRVKVKEGRTFSRPVLAMNQSVGERIPSDLNISIVCDYAVVRTFTDLLLNTGYGKLNGGDSNVQAEIHTAFFPDRVDVRLRNQCNRPPCDVIVEADKKYKWAAFEEIGGRIAYHQADATSVEVVMSIPYAGFCVGD